MEPIRSLKPHRCSSGPIAWRWASIRGEFRADPFRVLCAVADERLPFFLDSAMGADRLGRFSFIGCDPVLTVQSQGNTVFVDGRPAGRNPFEVLRSLLKTYGADKSHASHLPGEHACPVPFVGGAVGYFAYDLARFVERLPDTAVADIPIPEMHFAFYDAVAGFDHQARNWHVSSVDMGVPGAADRRKRLVSAIEHPAPLPAFQPVSAHGLRSNFTRTAYLAAVRKAMNYIAAGDIFQVNLSQRFEAQTDAAPLELYAALRSVNPAPFACYLPTDAGAILSSSPERYLRLTGRRVETRPIKGTRPRRARDEAFNDRMRRELLASAKDRAELTMIVDLERNDLGRVCSYGSVRVTEPIVLEEYPTVYHLVATVEGDLHPRHDIIDLIKATFPGGSITGAPKIRAMEIIGELEPTKRSVYTGNIGYIGFDGAVDLNIAIRTMILARGRVYLQAGGGIVADSEPEAEYQETLDKARAMLQALGLASATI